MYRCMTCDSLFPIDCASHKRSVIYIHGEPEDEEEDVCPYCGSSDLSDAEPEEE